MAAFVVSVSETSIHSFAHYFPDTLGIVILGVCWNRRISESKRNLFILPSVEEENLLTERLSAYGPQIDNAVVSTKKLLQSFRLQEFEFYEIPPLKRSE